MISLFKAIAATIAGLIAYVLFAPLFLLGFPIVFLAAICGAKIKEIPSMNPEQKEPIEVWENPLLFLWSNHEDGISGPTESRSTSTQRWIEKSRNWPWWRKVFSWCAIRNPVSNLRFSRLGCKLDRDRIEWIGNSKNPNHDYRLDRKFDTDQLGDMEKVYWCIARQGWRIGMWWIWPRSHNSHARIRLFWQIYPEYNPALMREIDRWCGMTLQGSIKRKD